MNEQHHSTEINHGPAYSFIRPPLRRVGIWPEILELLLLMAGLYTLFNLATVRFTVEGVSMEPTFHSEQYLIVSRAHYLFSEPERGDIVVFHYPGDPSQDYIKRLIGVPGDAIEFRDAQVYLNGERLEEPYLNEPCRPETCPDRVYQLGADEYFLMGDNRNRSSDSRVFAEPVQREHIVGEVLIRYWPPSEWGLVNRIGYPAP
ncbi:MAG: signal peptidase I [Anaerolineae bacterium]|jgi:signal peptidase I|nr:signal peptidase I [Anaerolineae bacterium]